MPKIALADSLLDWENLIGTASLIAEEFPEAQDLFGDLLGELRTEMGRARELDNRREQLQAERQEATRQLGKSRERSKELARRIRAHLKGIYGSSNPQLVQFGIKPRPLARGDSPPKMQVPLNTRKKEPNQG